MLDLRFIRENPDMVRKAMADRCDSAPIDDILVLDSLRRRKVGELDDRRGERKELSKQREKAQEKGRELRAQIQNLEEEVRQLDEKLEKLLLTVPNVPQASVPVGQDESGNVGPAAVRSRTGTRRWPGGTVAG